MKSSLLRSILTYPFQKIILTVDFFNKLNNSLKLMRKKLHG